MTKARELAAQILKGQMDADIQFHLAIRTWKRIFVIIPGVAALVGLIAIVTISLPWAIAGFVLCFVNLALMTRVQRRLNDHRCILPDVQTYLKRKKETNGQA